MKKIVLGAILSLLFVITNAQEFPKLDKSPHDIATYKTSRNEPTLAKVVYGRPQLKGRTMIGDKIPYGKIWRTGANEATEITFFQDVTFGGKAVKAGTYSLFTIPNEKEWTIILNSDLNTWGAYSYDEKKDVVRFNVPVQHVDKVLEAFSMDFEKENLFMGWDTIRIAIPIQF
ncbi:hypothetical protein UJ101_00478 [Flavobacteriaceae bacterium UJ101]|nr:hypothetical protein UJ101_00478 [Flavobacteriaceae bacterium UJ101]